MTVKDSEGDRGTGRVTIYLEPAQFAQAKAAHLADWNAGGQADTFSNWIATVIETNAARPVDQRTAHAKQPGERSSVPRSFSIPAATIATMKAAIAEEQQANRWPSVSSWVVDAINQATEAARSRVGGTLPPSPARLRPVDLRRDRPGDLDRPAGVEHACHPRGVRARVDRGTGQRRHRRRPPERHPIRTPTI